MQSKYPIILYRFETIDVSIVVEGRAQWILTFVYFVNIIIIIFETIKNTSWIFIDSFRNISAVFRNDVTTGVQSTNKIEWKEEHFPASAMKC